MRLLQNIDAFLGIIVSLITLVGFLGIMLKGRKNASGQAVETAPARRDGFRLPMVLFAIVAVAGLVMLGWSALKGGGRDGYSRWNGGGGPAGYLWRSSRERAGR